MNSSDAIPRLKYAQRIAVIFGVVGLVGALILSVIPGVGDFFKSYLPAYLFWFNLTLGCLFILMLHHLGGGRWSFSIRRVLESGSMLLPMMLLLFVPILLPAGMQAIYYRWFDPNYAGRDALIEYKTTGSPLASVQQLLEGGPDAVEGIGYLTYSGFLGRTVLYFIIWFGLAALFYMWSGQQDKAREGDFSDAKRMRLLAGGGILLYVLTTTVAATDWVCQLSRISSQQCTRSS